MEEPITTEPEFDNDLETLSTQKIKKLVKRTKETLEELRNELEKRKLDDQHSEIDHLEEHMNEAVNVISGIKLFIKNAFVKPEAIEEGALDNTEEQNSDAAETSQTPPADATNISTDETSPPTNNMPKDQ